MEPRPYPSLLDCSARRVTAASATSTEALRLRVWLWIPAVVNLLVTWGRMLHQSPLESLTFSSWRRRRLSAVCSSCWHASWSSPPAERRLVASIVRVERLPTLRSASSSLRPLTPHPVLSLRQSIWPGKATFMRGMKLTTVCHPPKWASFKTEGEAGGVREGVFRECGSGTPEDLRQRLREDGQEPHPIFEHVRVGGVSLQNEGRRLPIPCKVYHRRCQEQSRRGRPCGVGRSHGGRREGFGRDPSHSPGPHADFLRLPVRGSEGLTCGVQDDARGVRCQHYRQGDSSGTGART